MNVPSNYLAAVAHGKNADQTPEDGRLFVPPILVPSFDVPRPAVIEGSGTNGLVYNDSAIWSNYTIRTNQAAADVVMFYLIAGLWVLDFDIDLTWADLTTQNYLMKLALVDQPGSRADLFSIYWDRVADGQAHFSFQRRLHMKPRPDLSVVQGDSWIFYAAIEATNAVATQEIQLQMNVSAQRFL